MSGSDKYLVDYYKDGELVLGDRSMPNMYLAKTNGLVFVSDSERTPRANAMRVFHRKADGTKGRELGFYSIGIYGNWNKEFTKNAYRPDDPVYEEKVRHRLGRQKKIAGDRREKREEEAQRRREVEASRLQPALNRFVNFAGGCYDLNIPAHVVDGFLASVREGKA